MARYFVECIIVRDDAREESIGLFVEARGPEAAQADAEARAAHLCGRPPVLTVVREARFWPGPD